MTSGNALAVLALVALTACTKEETADPIPTGTVTGTATYAGLTDHSGIAVTANGRSATTDAAGSYSISGLPLGTCTVVAVAPRSTERTITATVEVPAGSVAAPGITFTPVEALAGQLTVLGVPVAGATVTLDGATTATTDVDGVYSFPDVRGGAHTLAFSATGGIADGIETVYYSPDTGATVPATYYYDVLSVLGTFDLQVATRLASVNVRTPVRSVYVPPTLSPNGQLYVYGITNDLGLLSLYVGSTSGGAPVLVTDEAFTTGTQHVRFAPDSSYLTFVKYNSYAAIGNQRYELFAAVLGAGPTVSSVTRVRDFGVSYGMEFSPHATAGAPKSLYFVAWDATSSNWALVEQNVNGGSVNTWLGVTSFYMAKKTRRVIFSQAIPDNADADTFPQYRLVSVAATGASVGTTVVTYEGSVGNTYSFSFSWHGLSPDETRFAYSLYYDASGLWPYGLKSAAVDAPSPVMIQPTTPGSAPACVSFSPASDRIAWAWTGELKTSPITSATASTFATASYRACPTFTSDGRIWLSYTADAGASYHVGLAPADNLTVVTSLGSVTASDLRSLYFGASGAAWIRGSATPYGVYGRTLDVGSTNTLVDTSYDAYLTYFAPSGIGGFFLKLDEPYATSSYRFSLWGIGLGGVNAVSGKVADHYYAHSASPADQSKAAVRSYDEEGNYQTLIGVDMGTATPTPLLRRTSAVLIQDVGTGTTIAPKVIAFRANSSLPYDHQDGVYIADP